MVVTAGIIDDEWLATVPKLAARAQARLAGLSTNAYEVVAPDSGHFVHQDAPDVVLDRDRGGGGRCRCGVALAPCHVVFSDLETTCVAPGTVPTLTVASAE